MCNPWCQDFVRDTLDLWPEAPAVLEVGARDVNGSVRPFCAGRARSYLGVDLEMGPGVDQVADVTRLHAQFAPDSFDVVITAEMVEHVPDWPAAFRELMTVLRPGGLLILTTRSPGFPRHDYPGDVWRFGPEDLRRIFADTGEVLRLTDDPTLEYPCGVGIVVRKGAAVDLPAWGARLAADLRLYNVIWCAHASWREFRASPAGPAGADEYRQRIAALEQNRFDDQIRSLSRRAETALLAAQLHERMTTAQRLAGQLARRDDALQQAAALLAQHDAALQQATVHIRKLDLSLVYWQTSWVGRLMRGADRCFELARLPVRLARYLFNRRLFSWAWAGIQRRWRLARPGRPLKPGELPHLNWLLQKLELDVPPDRVAAQLGRIMTRHDAANYRRIVERLRELGRSTTAPRVLRAMDLLPADAPPLRRQRILFVCGEFPNPIHGGGSRVADFIKVLGARHDVYVAAWYDRRRDHEAYLELAPYCQALRGLSFEDLEGGCAEKLLALIGHEPADVVHYEWPRSLQSLDRRLGQFHVYTHMEVASLSLWMDLQRLEPLSPDWCRRLALLPNMLGIELLEAARADLQIAVTAKDGDFLARFCPETPYYVVNHGINLDDFILPDCAPEPATVVFTGNFTHYPNQDAVHFFMREIRPRVAAAVPGLRVLIVGANPPPEIRQYHDGRAVVVTGRVPDVRPYIQQATVCMAPLISGAGLRTKVVQYAALRRPSVVTPIAVEDLLFENGREMFITADPREFADRLSALLRDPALAGGMADRAREKALRLYDNRSIAGVGLQNLYRLLRAENEEVA